MGPQLYRCGNTPSTPARCRASCCFNGAATLSLRKLSTGHHHRYACHNASMGPQLYRCGNQIKRELTGEYGQASMGPQLYRCGNVCCFDDPQVCVLAVLQWGRNFIVAETAELVLGLVIGVAASMGPQLYRCGNDRHLRADPRARHASMGPQLYRCGNFHNNSSRFVN